MTDEEKREQILKRALPALFITIIYFIFISDIMGEQAVKAQESHTKLVRKGISTSALPSIYKQQEQSRTQLSKLKTEQSKYAADIKKMSGFLSGEADTTETSAILADILAKYKLHVGKELRESYTIDKLPIALQEVRDLLQAGGKEKTIEVQHLWLHGSYNNMYAALAEMNQQKLSAIPVEFKMRIPEQSRSGELAWELILWM